MAAEERAAAAEHSRKAWEMFRGWGSPKYFVAPMVDQASCSGLITRCCAALWISAAPVQKQYPHAHSASRHQ